MRILACLLLCPLFTTACYPDEVVGDDPDATTAEPTSAGPPETWLDHAPDPVSRTSLAVFWFSASERPTVFDCTVDGIPRTPCTSPFAIELDDGAHDFTVTATDRDGERDDSAAHHRWTIDTSVRSAR